MFIGDIYIYVCVCVSIAPLHIHICFLRWRGGKNGTVSPKDTGGSREGERSPSPLCAMLEKLSGFYKCFFFIFDPVDPTHECI